MVLVCYGFYMELEEKKDSRNKQIMDAALKVFVKKGYENTTMDDIVKLSGLSKGAIYHYFKSKKQLFISLIDHWEVNSFPDFYNKKDDGRTCSKILIDFSEEVLSVFYNKRHVFLAEIEFWALANRDKDIKRKSKELYDKILMLFELVIKKGIRDGEFKDVDPKITAMYILSIFQGINWFSIFDENEVSPDVYLRQALEIVLLNLKS